MAGIYEMRDPRIPVRTADYESFWSVLGLPSFSGSRSQAMKSEPRQGFELELLNNVPACRYFFHVGFEGKRVWSLDFLSINLDSASFRPQKPACGEHTHIEGVWLDELIL